MEKTTINIVLLGKTGHGKSATGNTILGRKAFTSSTSTGSVTKFCKLECRETNDMLIRVVDTPGLGDTRDVSQLEIIQRIFNAMSLCPEGFNALVFVIAFGQRFTKEEKETLDILKQAFGEDFVRDFCIVVMTKGELFDPEEYTEKKIDYSFEDWLNDQTEPPEFLNLLIDCNRRVALFYNKIEFNKASFKTESENALQTFNKLIKSRNGRYTSHQFEKCAKSRNTIIAKLKLPTQSQFVQEQLSLMKQEIQATIAVIVEIKTATDKLELEENDEDIKAKLKRLNERVQYVIDKTKEEDNGTGVMQEFIDKMLQVRVEIEHLQSKSDQEIQDRLIALDEQLFKIKYNGSDIIEKCINAYVKTIVRVFKGVIDIVFALSDLF